MTSTTSTSLGDSEITETVSSSMNTDEVSATEFMDALQHGTIVAMELAPMELALSAQLGYYTFHFSHPRDRINDIDMLISNLQVRIETMLRFESASSLAC
ncbi:hypothetical protein ACFW04_004024 [Cataglyphis niger]